MRYILLFCIMMLSGCSFIDVKEEFPDVPEPLMARCENLSTIDKPKVLLSELLKTVTINYGKFHNCSDLVDAWQEWYTEQKKNASK